jgi:hypothetical protein
MKTGKAIGLTIPPSLPLRAQVIRVTHPLRPTGRRALLTATLGFLHLASGTSALRTLHGWLDSWSGVGHVVVGMARYGFRLSLKSTAKGGTPGSRRYDVGGWF